MRSWGWVVVVLACSSPRTAPDASPGACDPMGFDPDNCGACGHVCAPNEACYSGVCQSVCARGTSLCGTACFDLASDPNNCGACGKACNATHANVACIAGGCNITCKKSGADCDSNPENGCEIDLATDSKNCGDCGRDCLGGPCLARKCQPLVLAMSEPSAWAIAIDAANVYWTTLDSVRSCAKNNCVPTTIANNQQLPRGIATDANNVYWTTSGSVQACAKNNCTTPIALATAQTALGIATDGVDVYWAETAGGVVRRCEVSGCNNLPTTLASPFQPYAVAIDKQNMFFTSQDGVRQLPIGGGTPQIVTYDNAYALALDASNVYFTANGQVRKCAVAGCISPTVLASFGQAIALAVDATDVYWCAGNAIQKCAIGGCNNTPTTLATSQFTPFALAVDSTAIYWTNHGNGTIMRLAK